LFSLLIISAKHHEIPSRFHPSFDLYYFKVGAFFRRQVYRP